MNISHSYIFYVPLKVSTLLRLPDSLLLPPLPFPLVLTPGFVFLRFFSPAILNRVGYPLPEIMKTTRVTSDDLQNFSCLLLKKWRAANLNLDLSTIFWFIFLDHFSGLRNSRKAGEKKMRARIISNTGIPVTSHIHDGTISKGINCIQPSLLSYLPVFRCEAICLRQKWRNNYGRPRR